MIFTKKVRLLFCLLLLFTASVNAQDSTHHVKPSTRYITEYDVDRSLGWNNIDTNSNRLEITQATQKKYIVFQDLGNFGTASKPLLFDVDRNVGFQYTTNPYDIFFIHPEATHYYNTKTPYTDLYYSHGKNEILFLQAKHSQNITSRWNVGFDYQRITSRGFLPYQVTTGHDPGYTSMYNYQFNTAFRSKNQHYVLLANATWNRGLVEESGGIASDSVFESLTGANKVVSPKLTGAQTRFKNRAFHATQYWRFGSPTYTHKEGDTLYDFKSQSHLAYTFHAEEISYTFENVGNTDSTLMPHQYYDVGTHTYDSAYYGRIQNKLAFHFFNDKAEQERDGVRTFFGASLEHSLINVAQNPFIRQYQNLLADITFEKIAVKNYTLSYSAFGAYNLTGFNSGDYKVQAMLRYRFRLFDFTGLGLTQLYRPDYAFLFFKSNQFIWDNSFNKVTVHKLGGAIATRTWRQNAKLAFNQFALQNWTYAGADGTPKQEQQTIMLSTITLSKTFQVGKFFFEHELMYQTTDNSIIRFPEVGGMIRYYIQSRMFKRLKFQFGFSVFYNSAYYANGYNPTTRFFYQQNDTKIGNYPVFNPYFIGEIKQASFFVKVEHANQDWTVTGFYYTPHYPITLQSIQLGIRWRFYD